MGWSICNEEKHMLLELGGTAFITPYRFIYRVFYLNYYHNKY